MKNYRLTEALGPHAVGPHHYFNLEMESMNWIHLGRFDSIAEAQEWIERWKKWDGEQVVEIVRLPEAGG